MSENSTGRIESEKPMPATEKIEQDDELKPCSSCGEPFVGTGGCPWCGYEAGDELALKGLNQIPEGMRFEPETASYIFTKRWIDIYGMSALGVALLFLWFLIPELQAELAADSVSPLLPPGLMFFCYMALVPLANRTEIRVSPSRLDVRFGPLPVPLIRNLSLSPHQISEVRVNRQLNTDWDGDKYLLMVDTEKGGETLATFSKRQRVLAEQLRDFIRKTMQIF